MLAPEIDLPKSDPSILHTSPTPIGQRTPPPAACPMRQPTRTSIKLAKSNVVNHFKALKFGLLNVRSVGNDAKTGQISDFTMNEALDALALTET